jgi:hypothetical protein
MIATLRTNLIPACLMIAVPAFAASDAANTFGRYQIDAGKSSYTPASAGRIDKTMTVTRETSNGGVTQTTHGSLPDGTPFYASYTSNHDGKNVPVTGNAPFDTIAVKQVNANTVTDERKQTGGRYKATGRTVFSNSGRTMTVMIQGTNADGLEFKQVLVFDKQ